MSNKARKKKISVYGAIEGDREMDFLNHLIGIFKDMNNSINHKLEHCGGGTGTSIIKKAVNNQHYDRCFAWLDEDFEFNNAPDADIKNRLSELWCLDSVNKSKFLASQLSSYQKQFNLQKRKPILIISQPVCVDALLLKILDIPLPFSKMGNTAEEVKIQIGQLKSMFKQQLNGKKQTEFFQDKITIELLMLKRSSIPELDLLLSQIL